jgi:hypothetical protein
VVVVLVEVDVVEVVEVVVVVVVVVVLVEVVGVGVAVTDAAIGAEDAAGATSAVASPPPHAASAPATRPQARMVVDRGTPYRTIGAGGCRADTVRAWASDSPT